MKKFSNTRWLFFDIGSTLVDERAAYDQRIRDMIEGSDLSFKEVAAKREELALHGLDGNSAVIAYYGLTKTPWHGELETLYPDTVSTLEALKRGGYQLGILANQLPGAARRLEKWGIVGYFDVIASSAELGIAKPEREIFEKALEMAECEPNKAVMIGDRMDNDIIPAKKLGMHTVWIRRDSADVRPRELGTPWADVIVHTLEELVAVLDE